MDVLSIAASAPQKTASGPTLYKPLRELVALPIDETLGAAAPQIVGQLVARVGDETPFVVTCEKAQLSDDGIDATPAPVDVLNTRNVLRHAISSALADDDKRDDDDADKLSAERREELIGERKTLSKRCQEFRADVPARVLMAYASADESAAA